MKCDRNTKEKKKLVSQESGEKAWIEWERNKAESEKESGKKIEQFRANNAN